MRSLAVVKGQPAQGLNEGVQRIYKNCFRQIVLNREKKVARVKVSKR